MHKGKGDERQHSSGCGTGILFCHIHHDKYNDQTDQVSHSSNPKKLQKLCFPHLTLN